jgi:hypothetical protein
MPKVLSEKIYKIRRKSDGLFSDGGSRGRFSKKGTYWLSIGALKNHFNSLKIPDWLKYYGDCEVVSFKVTLEELPSDSAVASVVDFLWAN